MRETIMCLVSAKSIFVETWTINKFFLHFAYLMADSGKRNNQREPKTAQMTHSISRTMTFWLMDDEDDDDVAATNPNFVISLVHDSLKMTMAKGLDVQHTRRSSFHTLFASSKTSLLLQLALLRMFLVFENEKSNESDFQDDTTRDVLVSRSFGNFTTANPTDFCLYISLKIRSL